MKTTTKLVIGVSSFILGIGLIGACAVRDEFDDDDLNPDFDRCQEYEWDDEADTYVCDDEDSSYYRSYYYNRSFFPTLLALSQNARYNAYKSSGSTYKPPTTQSKVTKSTYSGFGSGTKGSTSTGG